MGQSVISWVARFSERPSSVKTFLAWCLAGRKALSLVVMLLVIRCGYEFVLNVCMGISFFGLGLGFVVVKSLLEAYCCGFVIQCCNDKISLSYFH